MRFNTYHILFLLFFFVSESLTPVIGQQNQYLSTNDTDPEATRIMDEISRNLDQYQSYELLFNFSFIGPDGTSTLQHGSIKNSGKKYRLELADQLVIHDGNYLWYFIKNRNEVQINDDDESGNSLSPTYFLNFYENKDFVYAVTNEYINDIGHKSVRIDFKPIGKFSEYKKIGIDVDLTTRLPLSLLIINSDGSRVRFYDLDLKKKEVDQKDFIFDLSKYPGIQVEDLRLD